MQVFVAIQSVDPSGLREGLNPGSQYQGVLALWD